MMCVCVWYVCVCVCVFRQKDGHGHGQDLPRAVQSASLCCDVTHPACLFVTTRVCVGLRGCVCVRASARARERADGPLPPRAVAPALALFPRCARSHHTSAPHVCVQHAAVLNVAVLAHQDQLVVPAQRRAEPHARALVELHVADHDGVWRHPGVAADAGRDRAEAVDGHPPGTSGGARTQSGAAGTAAEGAPPAT